MVFYQPGVTPHNLPRDPFKACVVPRPIGWISTRSATGQDNLAPYSQFNNLTFDPPYVMFAANQTDTNHQKDTTINVESTGRFVWNVATYDLREAVNITAEQVPYGEDEFVRAGLEKEMASMMDVPMVKASPIKFECEYYTTLRLPGNPPMGSVDVVVARVVGVHIDEEVLTEGKVDLKKVMPIARCGYYEYAVVKDTFEMVVPGSMALLHGMEGNIAENRRIGQEQKAGAADNQTR
ncbi:uncharacterized protein STEHIDRAFT_113612 [Stereum hirsutum FP-91666 SS1]|uniref:uncharacterized protein n=1 Tax=Stereum hirsutum (strain FP-91666) TaxID=721885 RepID=UPI0004449455|nr:uncharacterized protein STEHIDRAFT_113612 [Stereum hirsutum FP-91666 SS1]EIM83500.1 hypothetical protein STEHIDRAFT_113612 [Stereum hirsutum FP-91666 SS1]